MQNALKPHEWQRIWVLKTFKIEMQKEQPNNSVVLQNWFPQEIRFPLFNLRNFKSLKKVLLDHAECIEI